MGDLTDEERALIPNASREVTIHCIYKGLQLGPTVTMLTVLPYQIYKTRKNFSVISTLSRVGSISIFASALGVGLSLSMMQMKFYKENYNEYKIWDRAYRLRHSASQNRTDRFALASAGVGALTGFIIGLPNKYRLLSAVKGTALAVPFGILAHVVTMPKPSSTNKDEQKK